jgi:dipeptidyl-peptidase-4
MSTLAASTIDRPPAAATLRADLRRTALAVALGTLLAGVSHAAPAARASAMTAAFEQALRVAPWRADDVLRDADLRVRWIDSGTHLWHYRGAGADERLLVREARSGRVLRDLGRADLAWMGRDSGVAPGREGLQRAQAEISGAGRFLDLFHAGRDWRCDLDERRCVQGRARPGVEVRSPDGRLAAFVREHDIWVRDVATGVERALTTDGVEGHAYALLTEQASGVVLGLPLAADRPLSVLWSPDSSRLLAARVDESRVPPFPLVEHAPADSVAPRVHTYRYNFLAQGPLITEELFLFDVRSGARVALEVPTQPLIVDSTLTLGRAWWRPDGRELAVAVMDVEDRWVDVYKVDPESGGARRLFREEESYRLRLAARETAHSPSVRLLGNGDLLWYSHRSGYGHLHLVDGRSGEFRRQVTRGEWVVHGLLNVDEARGRVYFTAGGIDPDTNPYFSAVYEIGLDGSGLRRLTPEAAHHHVPPRPIGFRPWTPSQGSFAPDGKHFIDTYSTPREPEITVLRAIDGRVVARLGEATVAPDVAARRVLPESFVVPAPQGAEPLHGLIHFPSDFDPSRRYPVVDAIYNGQQTVETPQQFSDALLDGAQATAELGFIVVVVDGRGTPLRSRGFHDFAAVARDQTGSIGDHVHAIRMLAATRPYMDLDRIGIYGVSNGGYAVLRAMLAYPDFFKVGVSVNGSHDLRKYIPHGGINWVQRGAYPSIDAALEPVANQNFVGALRGRLLLIAGGMDSNAPLGNTLGVAQALIDAGKDFDFVLVPSMGHGYSRNPFATRKLWDHLVVHLLGATPPADAARR